MFSGNNFGRAWSWVGILLGGLVLAGMSGCGEKAPFDIIPVTGKITFEDGSLISASRIVVMFNPQVDPLDAKTYPKQGAAEVNVEDGTFSAVTTWKYGDGAIVGPHKITVTTYDEQENPTAAVPPIYCNPASTPLTAEVSSESTRFEFKLKKD